MSSLLILVPAVLLAAETEHCESLSECNRRGTADYQAGRFEQALVHFQRQVDYADTALEEFAFNDTEPTPKAIAAREVALNNVALAHLKNGECLKARAWLGLADAAGKATQANQALLLKSCATQLKQNSIIGDYWQYVGHGSWNQLTLNQGEGATLILDAFWMRISRGPMDQYGPAAFGSMAQVSMEPVGNGLQGQFEGYGEGEETRCTLRLELGDQAVEVAPQEQESCNTGGAGAYLAGRYVLVSTTPSPPQTGEDQ